MNSLRSILLTAAALAILPGASARAESIAITLLPQVLTLSPGNTAIFSGTITNLESVTIDLNGCAVNPPGSLTGDCTTGLFFDNAPFTLAAGETSGPFALFSVTLDPSYPGPYGLLPPGDFQITGNVEIDNVYDGGAQNLLATQSFSLVVAPEPSTFVLFGLAVLPLLFLLRRRAPANSR